MFKALLILAHKFFYLCRMVRNAVFAYKPAAVFCNEQVIFNTYAAEIFIGLKKVEINKFLAMTACFPVVYKCGNEVNPRLICYYEAFLQASS